MKRLAIRRLGVLIYCAFIFYLSSRNDYPQTLPWYPTWLPEPHLAAHFLLYSGLSLVVRADFRNEVFSFLKRNTAVSTVVFCAFYGLSDEFHQLFVPLRRFEMRDLLMDSLGPVAVMIVVALLRRRVAALSGVGR